MIGLKLIVAQTQGRGGATPQQFNESRPGFEIYETDLAQSVTFTTDPVDIGHGGTLNVWLTTANLTGTLVTSVLTSADNGANDAYRPAMLADSAVTTYAAAILGAFPSITTNTATRRRFVVDRWVKFTHTITTGPIDISVAAQMQF